MTGRAASLPSRQLAAEPAPTIFEAGVKDNVIPGRARAVVNFRILRLLRSAAGMPVVAKAGIEAPRAAAR